MSSEAPVAASVPAGVPARRRVDPRPWLKPGIFVGACVPLAALGVRAADGTLGANPIATVLNQLGLLALIFLVGSLAMTPLKLVLGWTWPIRVRRMVGLFAFFYASLHLLTYTVLDQRFAWGAIAADIVKRKFIFVGFSAWLLLAPLAITSTDRMVKRLGFVRWQWIHRLAYVTAGLGVAHFFLRVKKDIREPLAYGIVLAVLLSIRVVVALRKRARKHSARRSSGAG